ncbi:hypothetical protein B0T26DRAFT_434707 [Lasiosphaeria miniovina]|uniref:Uncharacterized protein n=1 Tax=Lasiosphaeria miniovina TaxID=1954250 RepID=A0AA40A6K3_9PEZI|nr:uncharacterized protein B0T26DRAFT_434707 [Lasiosphaeria miniovina]KAK0710258.1 hypothetical protein B0T26DRAFT_434707 [Lasiosphaeria miniovina]
MEKVVDNRHAQEERDGKETILNYLALQKLLKCSLGSGCKHYIQRQPYQWCFVDDGTTTHRNVSAEDIHKWVDEIGLNRRNKWNAADLKLQEAREAVAGPGSHPEWNPSLSGRRELNRLLASVKGSPEAKYRLQWLVVFRCPRACNTPMCVGRGSSTEPW